MWINIMSDFVASQYSEAVFAKILSAARQMCAALGTLCHMVMHQVDARFDVGLLTLK